MRKAIFLAIVMAFVLVSCNQKNKEEATETPMETSNDTAATSIDTTKTDSKVTAKLYACPMHPEVQGDLNDECPKCGMKLTEPVTENENSKK
jgi:hypothetical protein